MRRRRPRHRSWSRRLWRSLTGFGVAFVLALVVAIGLIWTVLPNMSPSLSLFSALFTMPDLSTIAELQRKAPSR